MQGAVDWGDPIGMPGEVFSYSDTGYILLGAILEHVTETSMGTALRETLSIVLGQIVETFVDDNREGGDGIDRGTLCCFYVQ